MVAKPLRGRKRLTWRESGLGALTKTDLVEKEADMAVLDLIEKRDASPSDGLSFASGSLTGMVLLQTYFSRRHISLIGVVHL
jgi:hypothetical protein